MSGLTIPGSSQGSVRGSVRVRVSASSANLGPGFDSLGLSLAIHDDVTVRTTTGAVTVQTSGEGADQLPRGEDHLVARAMLATFAELGVPAPGLALECDNRIPHGRGLGSSAAAIVAGVLAARALAPVGTGRLSTDATMRLVSRLEGHPDNVAACLFGGLTIAWSGSTGPRAIRLEPHPHIVAIVVVPDSQVSTKAARALLPPAVPHDAAAANASRVGLLVTALTSQPELLFEATEDRLHQDYRQPAMPRTLALVHDLRADGLAAAVSGAGPTVVVLSTVDDAAAAIKQVAGRAPTDWKTRRVDIDRRGPVVTALD